MLFYNHKHEFIGIDEDGLKLLNYATLEDLLGVCSDVADLFAKEPGYIHNFKSFGWIDFLLHADSDARSAIVHAHGRTFSCTLSVHSLFLCADPEQTGYMVDMTHIQSISGEEVKPFAAPKMTPYALKESAEMPAELLEEMYPTTPAKNDFASESLPSYAHITPTILSEPGTLDVPAFEEESTIDLPDPSEDLYAKLSLPLTDEELYGKEEQPPIKAETVAPKPKIDRPMLGDVHYSNAEKEFLSTLKVDKSYRFDPNVAASELGLPVDLIQEFIGDFIQQAYEFKAELFEAVVKGDISNVKILSHKLKGVAANLRIEDAFETLSIINTSNDIVEIEANLKYFYTIVEKLEGKEPSPSAEEPVIALKETPSDEFQPLFKNYDDEILLKEEHFEAPQPLVVPAEESDEDDIYTLSLKHELPTHEEKPLFEEKPDIEEVEPIDIPSAVAESDLIPEAPSNPLHYDKIQVAGELGIELDFFVELIEEFKTDALSAAQEITSAIGAFDTHTWRRSAAHLKGISDNLRLNEISEELAILSKTNDAQEANKASKRLNHYLSQL